MERDQSIELLKSSRTLDRANIFEGNTQKPFNFQTVTLDLTTAVLETAPKIFNFPFKCLYVVATTDSSVAISFKPNTQDSYQSALPLGQNDSLEFPDPLSSGVFYWAAQAGKTITLVFMVNGVIRPGKLVSVTSGGLVVSEGTSFTTSVVTLVALTAGIVAAANSSRTVSTIQNNTGSPIWLGPSTVTNGAGTLGIEVAPGASFQWKNTAVLYAYSVGGGGVTVMNEVQ